MGSCLWLIFRAYGIPQEILQVIRSFYYNFTCSVGNSDISFEVKIGVRQGCMMLAFLFNIVFNTPQKTIPEASGGSSFLSWKNLDFADDIVLLSHTHRHMQEKTNRLSTYAHRVGLRISLRKTEAMTLNPHPGYHQGRGRRHPRN